MKSFHTSNVFYFIVTAIYVLITVTHCDKGVPVTTTWRDLRLQMMEQPPILRSSSLVGGEVLTTPHRKNVSCYETFTRKASDVD